MGQTVGAHILCVCLAAEKGNGGHGKRKKKGKKPQKKKEQETAFPLTCVVAAVGLLAAEVAVAAGAADGRGCSAGP
jgi:hypothetical protein